jgi:hypothetical protein
MKIAFAGAIAAAALTLATAPLATPSKAQDLKMAQVDVQIGGTAPTATGIVGGMIPTPPWASAQVGLPSAREGAAAW